MITNDLIYSKNNGRIYTITDKCIGKGSYGRVFLAKNEYNKKVAIKCCPLEYEGIPNLFEASIMKTIIHPNINAAIDIVVNKTLYIIQDLAVMDLHHYTSSFQMAHICDINELKTIYYSVLQAVSILHHENIIHCDIKASNILIFEDGSIKLSDFSLATYDGNYQHTVCTASHRPLECLLKENWNKSLDIWSLGCTFYEIAYGELLFKNQDYDKKLDKNEIKRLIKEKSVNAIIDWAKYTNQECIDYFNIDYIPIQLTPHYEDLPQINKLIIKLLQINHRPSAIDLLKDELFERMIPENPSYITIKSNKLSHYEQARIVRYIQQGSQNEKIQNLAFNIYCKLDLPHLSEHYKAIGSTWIAHKIINGSNLSIPTELLPIDQILHIENEIVHDLHFRLH